MILKLFLVFTISAFVLAGTSYVLRFQLFARRESSLAIRKALDGGYAWGPFDRQVKLFKLRKEMTDDDRGLSDAYVVASILTAICLTAGMLISIYAL